MFCPGPTMCQAQVYTPEGAQRQAYRGPSAKWVLPGERPCPEFWRELSQKWNGLGASDGLQVPTAS